MSQKGTIKRALYAAKMAPSYRLGLKEGGEPYTKTVTGILQGAKKGKKTLAPASQEMPMTGSGVAGELVEPEPVTTPTYETAEYIAAPVAAAPLPDFGAGSLSGTPSSGGYTEDKGDILETGTGDTGSGAATGTASTPPVEQPQQPPVEQPQQPPVEQPQQPQDPGPVDTSDPYGTGWTPPAPTYDQPSYEPPSTYQPQTLIPDPYGAPDSPYGVPGGQPEVNYGGGSSYQEPAPQPQPDYSYNQPDYSGYSGGSGLGTDFGYDPGAFVGYKSGGRAYPLRHHNDWEEATDYEKSGGKLVHMSPDEYLKRVKHLNMDHEDHHLIHHFAKQMEKGEKFDPLAIYPDNHPNGRHRAHAAKKLGIKKVPVMTWPKHKADGGPVTPRSLAEAWTPPEEDPRFGQFIEEYPGKIAEALKSSGAYPHDIFTGEKQLYVMDPETGEQRIGDEAIRRALDISGGAMTGTFGLAPAGKAILGSGPIRQGENPRLAMDFRDVTKRVPELQEGASKVASGEMTPAQYQELVHRHKPVSEWQSVPAPATYEEMANAVRSNQVDKVGKGSTIPEGHPVGLRLDIPSYQSKGVWVPTIHDKSIAGKQPVMAHEPVALISDAVFHVPENKALSIAKGGEKSPLATINGSWVPAAQEEAMAMAQGALKDKEWRQVGMDPERHGYFYDRGTQEPILGAEQVLQVGPLVLAKNPRYGSKKDFKYKTGGSVVNRALMLTSKKAVSRRGRPD